MQETLIMRAALYKSAPFELYGGKSWLGELTEHLKRPSTRAVLDDRLGENYPVDVRLHGDEPGQAVFVALLDQLHKLALFGFSRSSESLMQRKCSFRSEASDLFDDVAE